LTIEQIVGWADAFHQQTGKWPSRDSGPIPGTSGETWNAVVNAFERGRRGLPRGLTLHRVLAAQGRDLQVRHKPPLRLEQILAWADAHHQRTAAGPPPMKVRSRTLRARHGTQLTRRSGWAVAGCPRDRRCSACCARTAGDRRKVPDALSRTADGRAERGRRAEG